MLMTTNERNALGEDVIALLRKHLKLTKGLVQSCTINCATGEETTIAITLIL